jgi:orotidine-5'-phosphate decarboxylase
MATQPTSFFVKATVPPVQINLGLDAFLTALEQEAKAAVDTPLDPPLDPQVIQHLQTMGDLAAQLKAELTAITALDPTALDRLKQRKQSAAS